MSQTPRTLHENAALFDQKLAGRTVGPDTLESDKFIHRPAGKAAVQAAGNLNAFIATGKHSDVEIIREANEIARNLASHEDKNTIATQVNLLESLSNPREGSLSQAYGTLGSALRRIWSKR